jgi:hypothetical protein
VESKTSKQKNMTWKRKVNYLGIGWGKGGWRG